MESRIGRSSVRARESASSPQGYQSTGLCACCSRYGLSSPASRLSGRGACMEPFQDADFQGRLAARIIVVFPWRIQPPASFAGIRQALYNDAIDQRLTVGTPVSLRRLKRPGPHVMKRKRPRSASLLMAACVFLLARCASSIAPPSASKVARAGLHRGTLEDRFLLSGELRAVRSLKLVVPRTPTWSIGLKWLAQ